MIRNRLKSHPFCVDVRVYFSCETRCVVAFVCSESFWKGKIMSYLFDLFLLKLSLVLFLNTVITTTVEHTSGSIDSFGPG